MTDRDKVGMINTGESKGMIICDKWDSFNGVN